MFSKENQDEAGNMEAVMSIFPLTASGDTQVREWKGREEGDEKFS